MSTMEAREEYRSALRQGQKEYRDLMMRGKNPNPAVLDEILPKISTESVQEIPLVEIPADRIVCLYCRFSSDFAGRHGICRKMGGALCRPPV